jgi:hypothetical protein
MLIYSQAVNHLCRTVLIAAGGDGAIATAIRDAVNAYATNNDNGTFETLRYSSTAGNIAANDGSIGDGETRKQHYKLVSGLLDNDKYLPLVLMNAGITLEIEWSAGNEAGCAVAQNFDYRSLATEVCFSSN